MTMTKV